MTGKLYHVSEKREILSYSLPVQNGFRFSPALPKQFIFFLYIKKFQVLFPGLYRERVRRGRSGVCRRVLK